MGDVEANPMTADPSLPAARWDRGQEVFLAVIECEPGERDAKLNVECGGDAQLREAVQCLLAGHERAGLLGGLARRLSAPAVWRARLDAVEQQGRRIARYHVLEQLGAGGMGFGYKAHAERLNRS